MLIRAKFVLNVYFIVQKGRLAYECLMALASLRCASPNFAGRVYVIEPQPGPLWPDDPRVTGPLRDMLMRLCDDWVPLHNEIFGANTHMAIRSRRCDYYPRLSRLFSSTVTHSFIAI